MAYARSHMGTPPTHLSLVGAGKHDTPAARYAAVRDDPLPRVLSLDAYGRILDWMHWQDAVCLYVRDAVVWTLGDPCLTVHGGINRSSGRQSIADHIVSGVVGRGHDGKHIAQTAGLKILRVCAICASALRVARAGGRRT